MRRRRRAPASTSGTRPPWNQSRAHRRLWRFELSECHSYSCQAVLPRLITDILSTMHATVARVCLRRPYAENEPAETRSFREMGSKTGVDVFTCTLSLLAHCLYLHTAFRRNQRFSCPKPVSRT